MSTTPRIGVIGPRRVRQGLGPFVARYLHEAGAEVCCFLSTSEGSCAAALQDWQELMGITASGYTSLDEMLNEQELDAIAICSPAETHHTYLEAALEAGLHVLCEKPLVWGDLEMVAVAHGLIAEFERRGLILWENCQWPYTLARYQTLYPETATARVQQFDMRLSPPSIGPEMLAVALPHPLSMLQALVPGDDARIMGVTFGLSPAYAQEARVSFDYRTADHIVAVHVHLTAVPDPPRPAAYAINGRWVHRLLRMDDYGIFFSDGLRIVDVPDPMEHLIRDFVDLLRRDWNAKVYDVVARYWRKIAQRVEMLHYLRTALEERIA